MLSTISSRPSLQLDSPIDIELEFSETISPEIVSYSQIQS